MKTGCAFPEIGERLGGTFLVVENCQIIDRIRFGPSCGRSGDDAFKNWPDRAHFFVQRRLETFTGRKTQAKCEASQSFGFSRNNVRLLFGLNLQTMFHASEKPIGVVQSQHFVGRKKVQFTKRSQRLEHTGFLQERMPRSMDQLQRLYDEFDVANTAASKFHVAFQLCRSNNVALDAVLDVRNFIQQIACRAFWINKGLMLPREFVGQLTATGDSACLD